MKWSKINFGGWWIKISGSFCYGSNIWWLMFHPPSRSDLFFGGWWSFPPEIWRGLGGLVLSLCRNPPFLDEVFHWNLPFIRDIHRCSIAMFDDWSIIQSQDFLDCFFSSPVANSTVWDKSLTCCRGRNSVWQQCHARPQEPPLKLHRRHPISWSSRDMFRISPCPMNSGYWCPNR